MQALSPLIDNLTGTDDRRRYQAVADALGLTDPAAFGLLVVLLIDVLARWDEDRSRQAAVALMALGRVALPQLHDDVIRRKGVRLRHTLANIIGVIGRRLTEEQQMALFGNLWGLPCVDETEDGWGRERVMQAVWGQHRGGADAPPRTARER